MNCVYMVNRARIPHRNNRDQHSGVLSLEKRMKIFSLVILRGSNRKQFRNYETQKEDIFGMDVPGRLFFIGNHCYMSRKVWV